MKSKNILLTALAGSIASIVSAPALASFADDSKLTIESRTAYVNSDDRSGGYDSKEAAQGFLFDFESGYTDGVVGFGVDAFAGFGLKLDGSVKRDAAGNKLPQTGLLPDNQKEYGKLGVTAKAKYSESVLKLGALRPDLPVLQHNNDRLMPQIFQGVALEVNEIDQLSLKAGQIREVNHRNSQDYEKMNIDSRDLVAQEQKGKKFNYVGADVKITDEFDAAYYYSNLEDYYKQHFLGATYLTALDDVQSVGADLRYFSTTDDGSKYVTTVNGKKLDNKTISGKVNYGLDGHTFGLSYQKSTGNTGFVKVDGTDSYLHHHRMVSDFAHKGEKSWGVSYAYDLGNVGYDGLTVGASYTKGKDVDAYLDAGKKGKEWERNTDVAYTFQEGAAKDLSLTLRNSTYRSNFANNVDEVRLIVSYPISL